MASVLRALPTPWQVQRCTLALICQSALTYIAAQAVTLTNAANVFADLLLYAPELVAGGVNGGDSTADVLAADAGSLDARLLLFQLLSAVAEVHARGESVASLHPSTVLLQDRQ